MYNKIWMSKISKITYNDFEYNFVHENLLVSITNCS